MQNNQQAQAATKSINFYLMNISPLLAPGEKRTSNAVQLVFICASIARGPCKECIMIPVVSSCETFSPLQEQV